MADEAAIQVAIAKIISAIGEDPARKGLEDTPRRVAEMYREIFSGVGVDPAEELTVAYELGHREMVVVRDIAFYSMCEHHLLPFFGTVHVGYIPDLQGRVVGLSKIARVVEIVARRPQIQERMVSEIADAMVKGLNPSGVAVVVQAEHMCMSMRGIRKPGANFVTSAMRGTFLSRDASRAEFLSLIQAQR